LNFFPVYLIGHGKNKPLTLYYYLFGYASSALTLLVGCWKVIQSVKKRVVGAGVVVCLGLEQDADLYMVQLMPLPLTISCFSKI